MLDYIAPQMSMMLHRQIKYSPFSKGITTQGPDPAEANTNQDLVEFVLHLRSYSCACVHSARLLMKIWISTYSALNGDRRKTVIVLYC